MRRRLAETSSDGSRHLTCSLFAGNKLDALRALKAWHLIGQRFDVEGPIEKVVDEFGEGQADARRRADHRSPRHGQKSLPPIISDFSGRIQIFVHPKEIGEEAFGIFKQLDIGDWIGVEGKYFLTKTGERTIRVKKLRFFQVAAAVAGKVARRAGSRDKISPALSGPDCESAIARCVS